MKTSAPKTSDKYSKFLIRSLLIVSMLVGILYYSYLAFELFHYYLEPDARMIFYILGYDIVYFIGIFLLVFSIIYVLIATLYFLYSLIRQAPWSKRPTTVNRLPCAAVLCPKVMLGTSILVLIGPNVYFYVASYSIW